MLPLGAGWGYLCEPRVRHTATLLQQEYLQELAGSWGCSQITGAWWPMGTAQHSSLGFVLGAAKRLSLLSFDVSPGSVERGRHGLSRAATDLTSTVSKNLARLFDIHVAFLWIQVAGPAPGMSRSCFPLPPCRGLRESSWLLPWLYALCHMLWRIPHTPVGCPKRGVGMPPPSSSSPGPVLAEKSELGMGISPKLLQIINPFPILKASPVSFIRNGCNVAALVNRGWWRRWQAAVVNYFMLLVSFSFQDREKDWGCGSCHKRQRETGLARENTSLLTPLRKGLERQAKRGFLGPRLLAAAAFSAAGLGD